METYQYNDAPDDPFNREPYCAKFRHIASGVPSRPGLYTVSQKCRQLDLIFIICRTLNGH